MIRRHLAALSVASLVAFVAPAIAAPSPPQSSLEEVIAHDGWSAAVLFQLGTQYASTGHPGRAVLAYERAELLAPRDRVIRAELAKTRDAAGLATPPRSQLDATLGALTSDEWAWLALGCGILACAGAAGYAWSIRRSASRVVFGAGVIATGLALAAAVVVAPPADTAVVVTSDLARIAPFAGSEGAFTAAEGEQVQIQQQRGDYLYVRDRDQAGWLPRAAIERVIGQRGVAQRSVAHT